MAVNYATIYEQALAQKFKQDLRFSALYTPSVAATGKYKWVKGKTVEIPVLTVGGFVDADRDNTSLFARKTNNAWETKTLEHDREYSDLVDPKDMDETNMVLSIANITKVFNDEEKIPEMDKYMSSKLYSEVDTNGTISNAAVSTSAEVLAEFDRMMEVMDEGEVPEEGRYLYITPAKYRLLRNALNASRQLGTAQARNEVSRILERLDDVIIVKVSTERMKSAYDFTVGAVPAVGAKQINMILVHPKSVIAPVKVAEAAAEAPKASSKMKWLYYESMYWDVFALLQRVVGIQINADAV
jgi:hypothetical protein